MLYYVYKYTYKTEPGPSGPQCGCTCDYTVYNHVHVCGDNIILLSKSSNLPVFCPCKLY